MTEEIRKILEDHGERLKKLEDTVFSLSVPKKNEQKKMSMKEFILSRSPKGDVQKTLVIGYYLEKYDGLSCFNMKDLENGFHLAKETIPLNINSKVVKNIEKGHMMEYQDKKGSLKAWCLTNSGEKFVEDGLKEDELHAG
jgi:hypothetical protein